MSGKVWNRILSRMFCSLKTSQRSVLPLVSYKSWDFLEIFIQPFFFCRYSIDCLVSLATNKHCNLTFGMFQKFVIRRSLLIDLEVSVRRTHQLSSHSEYFFSA